MAKKSIEIHGIIWGSTKLGANHMGLILQLHNDGTYIFLHQLHAYTSHAARINWNVDTCLWINPNVVEVSSYIK